MVGIDKFRKEVQEALNLVYSDKRRPDDYNFRFNVLPSIGNILAEFGKYTPDQIEQTLEDIADVFIDEEPFPWAGEEKLDGRIGGILLGMCKYDFSKLYLSDDGIKQHSEIPQEEQSYNSYKEPVLEGVNG